MRPGKNIEMLALAANALGELKDQVVFVGRATVGIYIDDPAAPRLRVTQDVDCVAEIASVREYRRFGEKLQTLGFRHPMGTENPPICRWHLGELKVDVMAIDEAVLGFSNKWYRRGMETAERVRLPDGTGIAVFRLPFFLASKIEAFLGRGEGRHDSSPDLEDVIAVLDGCKTVETELDEAPQDVKEYLRTYFGRFLQIEDVSAIIGGHLQNEDSPGGGPRAERMMALLRGFTVGAA